MTQEQKKYFGQNICDMRVTTHKAGLEALKGGKQAESSEQTADEKVKNINR